MTEEQTKWRNLAPECQAQAIVALEDAVTEDLAHIDACNFAIDVLMALVSEPERVSEVAQKIQDGVYVWAPDISTEEKNP